MPGCHICANGRHGATCDIGAPLRAEFVEAGLVFGAAGSTKRNKAAYYHAKAAWLAHAYGCWDEELASLSADERALLRAFVNRRRPDIPSRRAGMHHS